MKSVIVKFREYLPEASSTEKGIIQYLLAHPEQVAQMSIRELAKEVFASPSTITRLCHKTGFEQYKDFQKSLLYENAIRKETITDRSCEIRKEDTLEQLVDKIIYKSIVSLEDTKSLTDVESLSKSVDLLIQAQKIAFFGIGASLLVGRDAYLKFLRINKPCMVNEDFHAQLVQAKNMTMEDAAVIISYSGMTREMVECAEFEFRTGKLASRLSQLAVVDMLYVAYVQRDYKNCMRSLKKTFISKTEKPSEEENA